ncbi:MAG TPA: hypothetical protein VKC56_00695 [Gallionellaceae bacterium]|nr:hypothetical protein [Gallionellaceae bacterium]
MTGWNQNRYETEKQGFIKRRLNNSPIWGQLTLVFAATWGSAWFSSWFLWHYFSQNHTWASNLPFRYAIAFIFAYACFFLAVRVWIEETKKEPEHQLPLQDFTDGGNLGAGDGEGCLIVVALIIIGFILGGFFLASGGASILLEAAFDAAFAGVVVRRPILGDLVLGDWKSTLLANTWKRALLGFLVMLAMATVLHFKAPQATTIAQAVRAILLSAH